MISVRRAPTESNEEEEEEEKEDEEEEGKRRQQITWSVKCFFAMMNSPPGKAVRL